MFVLLTLGVKILKQSAVTYKYSIIQYYKILKSITLKSNNIYYFYNLFN